MRILVECASWRNVGDGFYQISLFNLIRRAFPGWSVSYLDAPIERAFRPSPRFLSRAFHLNRFQDADVYVFSGPILGKAFFAHYAPLITTIYKQKRQYCILSAHGDQRLSPRIKAFLTNYPPLAFVSRDGPTHAMYRDLPCATYDGICTAALVSRTCHVGDVTCDQPYITISFYNGFEPKLRLIRDSSGAILGVGGVEDWKPARFWRFLRHVEWARHTPTEIEEFKIVRPVHDLGYKFSHLNFARGNSFLCYNPLLYLSLYKNTSLTVSNRVHAIVPTLSFGRNAVFVGETPRSALLDRLGVSPRPGDLLRLSPSRVDEEYEAYLYFLCNGVPWP